MKHTYAVMLPSCGICVSHSHCKDCFDGVIADLLSRQEVQEASPDPARKFLTLDMQGDPEDLLDDLGIFILAEVTL